MTLPNCNVITFGGQRPERVSQFERCDDRALFYYLINHEGDPDLVAAVYNKVLAWLAQFPEEGQIAVEPPNSMGGVTDWLEKQAVEPIELAVRSRDHARGLVRQYAPAALVEGCWLQNSAQAASCHTEVSAHLFTLYTDIIGNGNATHHLARRYRQRMDQLEIHLPAVTMRAFSESPELFDAAFHWPVVQLSLALFPSVLLPELIGFTLGYAQSGSAWFRLCSMKDFAQWALPDEVLITEQVYNRRRHAESALQAYLAGCIEELRMALWQRVRRGYTLYRQCESEWLAQLHGWVEPSPTPRDKMIALVSAKAAYAQGHHGVACLGGKKLDDWFAAEPFDAEGFLDAVAESSFVNRDAPQQSRLLTDLTAFGGPMFRIFNHQERAVIQAWLETLAEPNPPLARKPAARHGRNSGARYSVAPLDGQEWTDESLSRRQLFFRLVNSDRFPDLLPVAKKIALRHLGKAGSRLTRQKAPLRQFFPYTHDAFTTRITQLYQKEIKAYQPFQPPPRFKKEVYRWGIEQLAPTILVDGCWLQNIAQTADSQSPLSAELLKIYADEVGNGDMHLNHPNVYRRLLESQKIDLPPLDQPDFAEYTGFLTAAFDLPIYLLAISHFPRSLLPEIIGLTLAIELSGLGAHYMTLVDELDYWGIDPTIIRLHLSIDNMAGGHAAIAQDVVQRYLDQVLASSGEKAMQGHWRRIWNGFLSLNQASKRFGVSMVWHYAIRFGLPRLLKSEA